MEEWKEPKRWPRVSTDSLIVDDGRIVLITRAIYPFKGKLCLPGGMVEHEETVENAAVREVKEETGLDVKIKEILGVYSDKSREPRFHAMTVAFITEHIGGKMNGSYEGESKWYDLKEIDFDEMGFDHGKIVKDYLEWKKKKGTYWSTK